MLSKLLIDVNDKITKKTHIIADTTLFKAEFIFKLIVNTYILTMHQISSNTKCSFKVHSHHMGLYNLSDMSSNTLDLHLRSKL